jgi:hypothetical protein
MTLFFSLGAAASRWYIAGLVFTLVGGFGLLARIGVQHGHMPGWAMAKIGIWGVFLAVLFILRKKPLWIKSAWPIVIILGGIAAYLAGNKPF